MAPSSAAHKLFTRLATSTVSAFKKCVVGLVVVFTWSYDGTLHNYTLEPVQLLLNHQEDHTQLRALLVKFRTNKEREINFVQKAAGLAAAAVIGAKSWSDTPTSYWLTPMLWNISLWCSATSLISSALECLLERLPPSQSHAEALEDEEVQRLLRLVLRPMASTSLTAAEVNDIEMQMSTQTETRRRYERHHALAWGWQCPMMLMSFAWVFFLVGYGVYVLTPLVHLETWDVQGFGALVSSVFGVLICVNFMFTAKIAQRAIALMESGL